jgi:hypothetical protein
MRALTNEMAGLTDSISDKGVRSIVRPVHLTEKPEQRGRERY